MKKWFVLYTQPKQELVVAEMLESIGISTYCPTVTIIKQYSDRKKKIKKPLLSSYLMVYLEDNRRNLVFGVPGVIRYLFFLGKPAQVLPSEIQIMQNHLQGIFEETKDNPFSVGSDYKISQGPFSGVNGKVIQSNRTNVKLMIKSLGISIILKKQAA